MKKTIMLLLITVMALGLVFTGCSKVEEMAEVKENIKEIAEVAEDIKEIINTEVTEEDKTNEDADKTSNSDEEDAQTVVNAWGEIAKYKVTTIIEEKINSEVYMLTYISEEKTENLVAYFDDLLKETTGYDLRKVTEKEDIIAGYLNGSINGKTIIVEIGYDNVKDENRVGFTSY